MNNVESIHTGCWKWGEKPMIENIYIVSAMRSRQTSGSWHVRGLHVVDSAAGFGTRTAPIGRCTDRPQVVVDFVIRLHEDSLLLATSVYVNWRASGKKNEKKEEIHKNGCDHV